MSNFLENSIETEIASFKNAVSKNLNKDLALKDVSPEEEQLSNLKKKKSLKKKKNFMNQTDSTIQIRISISVEQSIRATLLDYYQKTGSKISMREFADLALTEYIRTFK